MADSLFLVGVKDVRKHKGTEMQLVHPLRGGNTHQVKEWWRNGVNTTYTGCTIFNVTTAAGTVKLALATGKPEGAEVRIDHDGSFNFSFYHMNEIERAALYTDGMELIEHYVFPSIAGGPIMTVTPAGAASRPGAGGPPTPTETLTGVAFASGKMNALPGDIDTYTFTHTGTATDIVDVLTSSDSGDSISGGTVTFGQTGGSRTLTVTSSSSNAGVTGLTDTRAVTVFHLIGTVTVSGDGSPNDGDTGVVYTAAIGGTAENLSYAWTATGSASIDGDADQQSVTIDFSGTDESVITCEVSSSDSFVQDSPQSGNVTLTPTVFSVLVAAADDSFVVTQVGGYYYIDGVQQAEVTATAGETLHFDLSDASLSGHPFKIYTDSTKTTEVTVGIEQQGTDLLFTPPISGSFSYQCGAHANMGGDITIAAAGGGGGGY